MVRHFGIGCSAHPRLVFVLILLGSSTPFRCSAGTEELHSDAPLAEARRVADRFNAALLPRTNWLGSAQMQRLQACRRVLGTVELRERVNVTACGACVSVVLFDMEPRQKWTLESRFACSFSSGISGTIVFEYDPTYYLRVRRVVVEVPVSDENGGTLAELRARLESLSSPDDPAPPE